MIRSNGLRLREKFINLAGRFYLLKKKGYAHKAGITVLNYHRISRSSFKKHLDYIRVHYQVVSPEVFLDWLYDKRVIDTPSVLLTFDDGYVNFYEEIYPILRGTETPALIFVATGLIGKTAYFWADELEVAVQKTSVSAVTIDDKKFYLYSRVYRADFYENIVRYMRRLDEGRIRETMEDLFLQLKVKITGDDMKGYRVLNWSQVLEMEKSGLIVFGSHTVNHSNLINLTNEEVKYELLESKSTLESHIGKQVRVFAFPYGGPDSFNGYIVNEVRRAGYVCAFTTIQGKLAADRENRFRLPRVLLFDYQNQGAVALKLDRYK